MPGCLPLDKDRWEGERDFPGLDEFSKSSPWKTLSAMDDDSLSKRLPQIMVFQGRSNCGYAMQPIKGNGE